MNKQTDPYSSSNWNTVNGYTLSPLSENEITPKTQTNNTNNANEQNTQANNDTLNNSVENEKNIHTTTTQNLTLVDAARNISAPSAPSAPNPGNLNNTGKAEENTSTSTKTTLNFTETPLPNTSNIPAVKANISSSSAYTNTDATTQTVEMQDVPVVKTPQSASIIPNIDPIWDTETNEEIVMSSIEPVRRIWNHVTMFFLSVFLAPITWYLISDSMFRLSMVENSPWDKGTIDIYVLAEVLGALLAIFITIITLIKSTFGLQTVGILVSIIGAIGVFDPAFTKNTLLPFLHKYIDTNLSVLNNALHHFEADIASGRILFFGFIILVVSLSAHFVRRQGAIAGVRQYRYENNKQTTMQDF